MLVMRCYEVPYHLCDPQEMVPTPGHFCLKNIHITRNLLWACGIMSMGPVDSLNISLLVQSSSSPFSSPETSTSSEKFCLMSIPEPIMSPNVFELMELDSADDLQQHDRSTPIDLLKCPHNLLFSEDHLSFSVKSRCSSSSNLDVHPDIAEVSTDTEKDVLIKLTKATKYARKSTEDIAITSSANRVVIDLTSDDEDIASASISGI